MNQQENDRKYLLDKVNNQIKNQKMYENKYKALGQINPELPLTETEKQIKLTENIVNPDILYTDAFQQLLAPYLSYDNILKLLYELNDNELKEIVLNWKLKYEDKFKALEGKNIEYQQFIDYIHDMVAKAVNDKYQFKNVKLDRTQDLEDFIYNSPMKAKKETPTKGPIIEKDVIEQKQMNDIENMRNYILNELFVADDEWKDPQIEEIKLFSKKIRYILENV